MASRQPITLSLPRAVVQKVESIGKRDRRSRSEVVGEALERYFSIRAVRASRADLGAMRRARAEIKAGKFVTLDEALHGMDTPHRKTSRKIASENSR